MINQFVTITRQVSKELQDVFLRQFQVVAHHHQVQVVVRLVPVAAHRQVVHRAQVVVHRQVVQVAVHQVQAHQVEFFSVQVVRFVLLD